MRSKIFSKLLTLIVVIGMLASVPGVPVAAVGTPPMDAEPYMASEDDLLYFEDFTGDTELSDVDGDLMQVGEGGGTLTLEDGKLVLERTSTQTSHDGLRLFFGGESFDGYSNGSIALEFEMEREHARNLFIITRNGGSGRSVNMTIGASHISAWSGSEPPQITWKEDFSATGMFKVILLHNHQEKTYSIWIDGEKIATDGTFRDASPKPFHELYIYAENTAANKVQIDNIRVYKATTAWPSYTEVTGYAEGTPIYTDFTLPAAWPAGSENALTWTSNKPEIEIEGNTAKVATLHEDRQEKVMLTATMVRDGQPVSADYTVTLAFDTEPYCASDDDILYFEDFDNKSNISEVDGLLEHTGEMERLEIENGRLVMERTGTAGTDGFNLFFKANKAAIGTGGERVALEFEMEREDISAMIIRTFGASQAGELNIHASRNINIRDGGSAVVTAKENWTDKGPVKFIILHDFQNNTYSVWLDGERLVHNVGFRNEGLTGFRYWRIYMEANNQNTIYIDNVKVYNATLKMGGIVEEEFETLKEAGFAAFSNEERTAVSDNLFVPTGYQSDITFSSKNGLVSADGTVNLQKESADDVVTVTISQGEHVRTLEYPITILSAMAFEGISFENPHPIAGQNYATLNIYSRNNESYEVAFIVAAYEGNRLLDISVVPCTVTPKDVGEDNFVTKVDIESVTGDTKVKAFLWDSFQTMRPIEEVNENSQ